jgi:predicted amidohydrolase YtcJ
MNSPRSALLALIVVAAVSRSGTNAQQVPVPATLVLRGGRILTVDASVPQAEALAVRGDRIVAVGGPAQVNPFVGPDTEVIELRGRTAIPGFIDGHLHLMSLGESLLTLQLSSARSWDEVVTRVGDATRQARPGDWIIGRGWHQEKWASAPEPNVERFPTHAGLSRVSPDNPVMLLHASGHATFANAAAMRLAHVDRTTPNPSGGEILKDAAGEPTGLFRETAARLIDTARERWRATQPPERFEAEARSFIARASTELLSKGVTSAQDAGVPFSTIDFYKRLVDEHALPVRVWAMIRTTPEDLRANLARYRLVDYGDHRLTVRAIKLTIDGALGSRGAWLLQPYSDMPGSTGLNTTLVEAARETAALAVEHGFQFCVHAIGDRANREVLNIYEDTSRRHPEHKDLRWRIEHAQHLSLVDIPRFRRLGVIASMQAIHCTSDAPFVIQRLGAARAEEGAYVWQKLMKNGAHVSNGTDAPVEDVDPIPNYYAAVSRRLPNGTTFYPDQRMSRIEALRAYTIEAAYAAFEENIKGSLAPGKLADIVVLTQDITTVPEEQIPATKVSMTILGGKVAYTTERTSGVQPQ